MKVNKYTNTREKEEVKRGRLFFLNFKLTHNQSPINYIEVFNQLMNEDPLVNLKGDKFISMTSLIEDNILDNQGLPRLILGKIATYDILDKNAFYDKKNKRQVTIEIDKNIVANFKYIDFYFCPSAHRLAFFDNQPVKYNQVLKYFQDACDTILGQGQIIVSFEASRDVIERILNADAIESFQAVLSYSNKDLTDKFTKTLESKTESANAARLDIKLTPPKGEYLNKDEDGIIEAATRLSKSNGYAVATIREGEKRKRTVIDTTEHPMKELFSSKLSELNSSIYTKIMSIFRP